MAAPAVCPGGSRWPPWLRFHESVLAASHARGLEFMSVHTWPESAHSLQGLQRSADLCRVAGGHVPSFTPRSQRIGGPRHPRVLALWASLPGTSQLRPSRSPVRSCVVGAQGRDRPQPVQTARLGTRLPGPEAARHGGRAGPARGAWISALLWGLAPGTGAARHPHLFLLRAHMELGPRFPLWPAGCSGRPGAERPVPW